MPKPISGLVWRVPLKRDWTRIRKQIEELEPGSYITFTAPDDLNVNKFRSVILTVAKRTLGGKHLSTRTEGRKIHCYLSQLD